ncbi:MAG: ABC transporter ATP-binding protein [Arenicellales bacterium]|nr:ABC transporter ATP-binding protein [Arenicellales bacterium]MDP6552724.1 ABC transporter ATP-binding protein [Arenicellales bacterium]MDP6791944.1 ABC transporter ATP-binding protein [Arenicellales bacterium]MDP6919793.1 ABC transporter ATP-binding protein [Arenicellales bacterium]|tara:strand:+ start:24399 stop:26279 length:1881 start_codon:yes stop_codon:yes gene_type:complete
MSEPLLSVRDLRLVFRMATGEIEALHGVDFDIDPGSTVALVGESGSGKSVTAQAIMGILPGNARITSGQLIFNDPASGARTDIASLPAESPELQAIRGARISIIFQEPMVSLSPLHTVGDQVSEALFLHHAVSRAQGMEQTEAMLEMVGFPNPARALRTYPFELSGGLRQRAMIAMALVCRPSLLIADEPTTALDVTVQAQILNLIRDLQAELKMALLLITHDLGVVANMAQTVVVMYHGRIVERGAAAELFSEPGHPYLRALFKAVPRFGMERSERLVPVRAIEHELGEHFQTPASATAHGEALLDVRHLCKSFTIRGTGLFGRNESTEVKAVDDVSFAIQRGECLGLVGESGCGKTTVSKILMRALSPDSGSVEYHDQGEALDLLSLDDEAMMAMRCKMQLIFQDPFSSLSPRMTVFDIVREPLVIHQRGDTASQRELVQELMRLVGLDPRFLSRYPHSFSGGQRQRISIARALALQPQLLICDEPVSALDVSIQAQVLNLLKDLKSELGLTYLFISHNLAVIDYIADRVAVMHRGRLVEIASRDQLFSRAAHPYTRSLLQAVPHPDLARPLDFAAITASGGSDPDQWPAAFQLDAGSSAEWLDLGQGHRVRARANANPGEIVQ